MTTDNYFLYPKDVNSFGFDWGRLALTVAPEDPSSGFASCPTSV